MTQKEKVLKCLLDGQVLDDYCGLQIGVGAIRSRVSELIQEGYPIKKGWRKNQINGFENIRTYYIEKENNNELM